MDSPRGRVEVNVDYVVEGGWGNERVDADVIEHSKS